MDGPAPPGTAWAETSWPDFYKNLKAGGLTVQGAYWLTRALMQQRGITKDGFEELERLVATIIGILDANRELWQTVLPLPLLGPEREKSYTVSSFT